MIDMIILYDLVADALAENLVEVPFFTSFTSCSLHSRENVALDGRELPSRKHSRLELDE